MTASDRVCRAAGARQGRRFCEQEAKNEQEAENQQERGQKIQSNRHRKDHPRAQPSPAHSDQKIPETGAHAERFGPGQQAGQGAREKDAESVRKRKRHLTRKILE
jgi:hypothetical protein